MAGKRSGKLVAIKPVGKNKWGLYNWLCKCDCGKTKTLTTNAFGRIKSCGCLKNKIPILDKKYHCIYNGMMQRCYNLNDSGYKNYGGRGIKVCERWRDSFENFVEDIKTMIGKRPSGNFSLDRVNNNGNYEPGSIRWATPKQQINNSRHVRKITYKGKTQNMSEWAEEIGITREGLRQRLGKYPIEEALQTTVKRGRNKRMYKLNGAEYTIDELSKMCGISEGTIYHRIRLGMIAEEAIKEKPPGSAHRQALENENERLKLENKILWKVLSATQKNEVLKKMGNI